MFWIDVCISSPFVSPSALISFVDVVCLHRFPRTLSQQCAEIGVGEYVSEFSLALRIPLVDVEIVRLAEATLW